MHPRPPLLPLWLLASGCVPALEADDVCAEVIRAVAVRTYACSADGPVANAAAQAFEDEATCVVSMDDPTVPLSCASALLQVDCAAVAEATGPAWWMAQSEACTGIFDIEATSVDTGPSVDTGTPPAAYTGLGSCEAPLTVDLSATPLGQEFAVALPVGVGDSPALDACAGGTTAEDHTIRFITPAVDGQLVYLTLTGPADIPGPAYVLLGDPDACPPDPVLGFGCGSLSLNVPTLVAQTAGFVAARRIVIQPAAGTDLGARGVVAHFVVEPSP